MIRDPFAVLGVSPSATDEELKKAYRKLSKEWHPDQHPDQSKQAEERFKDIQEAYRQIVEARERGADPYGPRTQTQSGAGQGGANRQGYGYAAYGTGFEAFNEFFRQWEAYSQQQRSAQQSGYRRRTAAELEEAKASAQLYLDRGDYLKAAQSLDVIDYDQRDAQWFYLAALAHRGMGNNLTSLNYAKQASDLEPDNGVYAALLRQMQAGGTRYQSRSVNYGGMHGFRAPNLWTTLCIANIFCNLCCRL